MKTIKIANDKYEVLLAKYQTNGNTALIANIWDAETGTFLDYAKISVNIHDLVDGDIYLNNGLEEDFIKLLEDENIIEKHKSGIVLDMGFFTFPLYTVNLKKFES